MLMKLKITKDIGLARPEVWLPHWKFKAGQVIETDNEHLQERLFILGVAKKVKEDAKEKDTKEDVAKKKVVAKKALKTKVKNKKQSVSKNKSFADNIQDLDVDIE